MKQFLPWMLVLALIAPAAPARAFSQTDTLDLPVSCTYNSQVDALLRQTSQSEWEGWIRRLSGEEDVYVGGTLQKIHTRYSEALFDGTSPGFDYLRAKLNDWYQPPDGAVEEDAFQTSTGQTWKNLILTIPGSTTPDEVVIISAHFDSYSPEPYTTSPGADDNASGAATLLEAARVLRGKHLPRTLRLIWFTGEEQWMVGSKAYLQNYDQSGVKGVVNVDMIGYDGDADRCFELHVGTLEASDQIGQCFVQAIDAYQLDLRYEYKTITATVRSDHASFWNKGIGAVEVLENALYDEQTNGCAAMDINPYIHTTNDRLAYMTPAYGYDVARAALATAFSLATPPQKLYLPVLLKNE